MHMQVEHIELERAGKRILDDVSFEVFDGEFVSILGESGAGKSTTLKVIAGLIVQDAGTVRFDGTAVDDLPTHKRSAAIVFQDFRLFPNMNVRDNVSFSLKMQGMRKAERAAEADSLLDAVRLGGLGDRRVSELSGGQQQRVALARALAGKPRALLLDEPFSGLDEQLRADMRDLVMTLHRRFNTTSVMVTHDADEALTMSDRIICMGDGRALQSATPEDLLLSPVNQQVAACFNKSSALPGTVSNGRFVAGKLDVDAQGAADGAAVLVRLEDGRMFVHQLDDTAAFTGE